MQGPHDGKLSEWYGGLLLPPAGEVDTMVDPIPASAAPKQESHGRSGRICGIAPELGQLVESPLRSGCDLGGATLRIATEADGTGVLGNPRRQRRHQDNVLHGGPQAVMADSTPAGFLLFHVYWLPSESQQQRRQQALNSIHNTRMFEVEERTNPLTRDTAGPTRTDAPVVAAADLSCAIEQVQAERRNRVSGDLIVDAYGLTFRPKNGEKEIFWDYCEVISWEGYAWAFSIAVDCVVGLSGISPTAPSHYNRPMKGDVFTFETVRDGDTTLLLVALRRYVQAILALRQKEAAAGAASKARVESWLTSAVADGPESTPIDEAARMRLAPSSPGARLKRRPGQLVIPGEGPLGDSPPGIAAGDIVAVEEPSPPDEGILTPDRGQLCQFPLLSLFLHVYALICCPAYWHACPRLVGDAAHSEVTLCAWLAIPDLAIAMRAAALATEEHSPRTAALKLSYYDRACFQMAPAATRMREQQLRQDENAVLARAVAVAQLAQAATTSGIQTPSRMQARLQAIEWRSKQEVAISSHSSSYRVDKRECLVDK